MSKARICFAVVGTAAICLSVGACAIQRAQTASQAKTTMIGMSKEGVLACMGTPVRAGKSGGTEVWTYNSGDNETDSFGSATAFGGRFSASAFGSSVSTTRSCKIDIVMNQGKVTRINYSGPTGGLLTEGEECAYAVSNCVQTSPETAQPIVAESGEPASAPVETETAEANGNPPKAPSAQFQSFDNWETKHKKSGSP